MAQNVKSTLTAIGDDPWGLTLDEFAAFVAEAKAMGVAGDALVSSAQDSRDQVTRTVVLQVDVPTPKVGT